jgi:NADH-quinone oxidoreductase subunit L
MEAAYASGSWYGQLAFWMSLAAAFMTAFYSWRLIIMTFHGKPRASEEVMDHVHESPSVMLVPLFVLAMGAVFSGAFFYEPFVGGEKAKAEAHETMMEEAQEKHKTEVAVQHAIEAPVVKEEEVENGRKERDTVWSRQDFWGDSILVLDENDSLAFAHHAPEWVKFSPLVVGLLGIAMAYLIYMTGPGVPERMKRTFPHLYKLSFNKWYFDEIYDFLFVRRAFGLGRIFTKADRRVIDRFGPDGGAAASSFTARIFSRFQTGFIYQYAFVMMIAVISLLSWFAFRTGTGG